MSAVNEITRIQDEDVLKKMWQETEDFGKKKEIRAHMYKLREERLKDLYCNSDIKDVHLITNKKTSFNQSMHADALADHSFASLKRKEIRDSESPTKEVSYRIKGPSNEGWNISKIEEHSQDGKSHRYQQSAHTSGTEYIPKGKLDFEAKNSQEQTSYHDGDDSNFVKSKGTSSNSFIRQEAVGGDENSSFKTFSTKSSTSSKTVTEMKSSNGDAINYPRQIENSGVNDQNNFRTSSSRIVTSQDDIVDYPRKQIVIESTGRNDHNNFRTSSNTSSRTTTEQKSYGDSVDYSNKTFKISDDSVIDKTTKVYTADAPRELKSHPGYVEGRTKITKETKTLADGTVVTTTKYETSGANEAKTSSSNYYTTSSSSFQDNKSNVITSKSHDEKHSTQKTIEGRDRTQPKSRYYVEKTHTIPDNTETVYHNTNTRRESNVSEKKLDTSKSYQSHVDQRHETKTVNDSRQDIRNTENVRKHTVQHVEIDDNRRDNIDIQRKENVRKETIDQNRVQQRTVATHDINSVPLGAPIEIEINLTRINDNQERNAPSEPQTVRRESKPTSNVYDTPQKREPIKHDSELKTKTKMTDGQYNTTYRTDFTNKKISVEVSPTHDAFARSLRAVSPDRLSSRTSSRHLKNSNSSLRSSSSPEKSYMDRRHPQRMSPDRQTNGRCYSPTKKTPEKFSSTETITYRTPSKPGSQRYSPDKNQRRHTSEIKLTTNYSTNTLTRKSSKPDVVTPKTPQTTTKNVPRSSIPNGREEHAVFEITTDLDDNVSTISHSNVTKDRNERFNSEVDIRNIKNVSSEVQEKITQEEKTTTKPLKREQPIDRPLKRTDTYEERCRQILGITSDTTERRRSSLEKLRKRGSTVSSITDSIPKTSDKPDQVPPGKPTEPVRQRSPSKQGTPIREFPSQVRKTPEKYSPEKKVPREPSLTKERKPSTERRPIQEFPSQIRRSTDKQVSPTRNSPSRSVTETRQERKPSTDRKPIQEFPSQTRKSPKKEPTPTKDYPTETIYDRPGRKSSTGGKPIQEFPSQIRKSPEKQRTPTRNSPESPIDNRQERKPSTGSKPLQEFPSQIRKSPEKQPTPTRISPKQERKPSEERKPIQEFPSQTRSASKEREPQIADGPRPNKKPNEEYPSRRSPGKFDKHTIEEITSRRTVEDTENDTLVNEVRREDDTTKRYTTSLVTDINEKIDVQQNINEVIYKDDTRKEYVLEDSKISQWSPKSNHPSEGVSPQKKSPNRKSSLKKESPKKSVNKKPKHTSENDTSSEEDDEEIRQVQIAEKVVYDIPRNTHTTTKVTSTTFNLNTDKTDQQNTTNVTSKISDYVSEDEQTTENYLVEIHQDTETNKKDNIKETAITIGRLPVNKEPKEKEQPTSKPLPKSQKPDEGLPSRKSPEKKVVDTSKQPKKTEPTDKPQSQPKPIAFCKDDVQQTTENTVLIQGQTTRDDQTTKTKTVEELVKNFITKETLENVKQSVDRPTDRTPTGSSPFKKYTPTENYEDIDTEDSTVITDEITFTSVSKKTSPTKEEPKKPSNQSPTKISPSKQQTIPQGSDELVNVYSVDIEVKRKDSTKITESVPFQKVPTDKDLRKPIQPTQQSPGSIPSSKKPSTIPNVVNDTNIDIEESIIDQINKVESTTVSTRTTSNKGNAPRPSDQMPEKGPNTSSPSKEPMNRTDFTIGSVQDVEKYNKKETVENISYQNKVQKDTILVNETTETNLVCKPSQKQGKPDVQRPKKPNKYDVVNIEVEEIIQIDSDEEIDTRRTTQTQKTIQNVTYENEEVDEIYENNYSLPDKDSRKPTSKPEEKTPLKSRPQKPTVPQEQPKERSIQKPTPRTPSSSSISKKPTSPQKIDKVDNQNVRVSKLNETTYQKRTETDFVKSKDTKTNKIPIKSYPSEKSKPRKPAENIDRPRKPINEQPLVDDGSETEEEIVTKKQVLETYEGRTPVEEPLVVKKTMSLLYSDDEDDKKTTQLLIESEIIDRQPITEQKKPKTTKTPKTTTTKLINNEKKDLVTQRSQSPLKKSPSTTNDTKKPITQRKPEIPKQTQPNENRYNTIKKINKQNSLKDIENFNGVKEDKTIHLRTNRVDETVNKKKTTIMKSNDTKPVNKPSKITPTSTTSNGLVPKKPSSRNVLEKTVIKTKTTKTSEPTKPLQKTTKSTIQQKNMVSSTVSSKSKIETKTSRASTLRTKTEKTETIKSKQIPKKIVGPEESDEETLPDSLNGSVYSSLNDIRDDIQEKEHILTTEKIEDFEYTAPSRTKPDVPEEKRKITKLGKKILSNKSIIDRGTVDLQRSISSREPTPDRVCPLPVTSDDDGEVPRYPDKVVEPDETTTRRRHERLFETSIHEDSDYTQSKKIVEINEDTNQTVTRIDRVDNDDDSLMTVDKKINKFLSTAGKLTEKSIVDISEPAPKVERPKFEVNEDLKEDDCLLSVSDKVQKFITEAEHLTTQKDTQHRKSVNIDVKSDVSNKISQFTSPQQPKSNITSPRKSSVPTDKDTKPTENKPRQPEHQKPVSLTTLDQDVFITTECAEIEKEEDFFRTSKRPSQPKEQPKYDSPRPSNEFRLKTNTSNTTEATSTVRKFSIENTERTDDVEEEKPYDTPSKPRKNSLKDFTPKNRRPSQEEKVILSSVGRLRSNESIKKAKALFENTESINREEKRQKDILSRPSVFEGRSKDVNLKKTIDRTSVTPKRLDFTKESEDILQTTTRTSTTHVEPKSPTKSHGRPSIERDVPGYMKPLDRNTKQRDQTPERDLPEHEQPRRVVPNRDDRHRNFQGSPETPGYMKSLEYTRPNHSHREKSPDREDLAEHNRAYEHEHPRNVSPNRVDRHKNFQESPKTPGYMKSLEYTRPNHSHREKSPDREDLAEHNRAYEHEHPRKVSPNRADRHQNFQESPEKPGYMKSLEYTRPNHSHREKSPDREDLAEHNRAYESKHILEGPESDVPGYMQPLEYTLPKHAHEHETQITETVEHKVYNTSNAFDDHQRYSKTNDLSRPNVHPEGDLPGYMKPLDRSSKPQHPVRERSKSPENHRPSSRHPKWGQGDDLMHRNTPEPREHSPEGDVPGYMKPLDRSNRTHSPQGPKKDVHPENKPKEPTGTPTKFGVTLKRTDSSRGVTTSMTSPSVKRHPLLSKKNVTEEEIEEVYDLEVLEELLLKFTIYELRRKIRTQIRIVKKLISENKLEITIKNLKNKSSTTNRSVETTETTKVTKDYDDRSVRRTTPTRKVPENRSNVINTKDYEISSRKESVSSSSVLKSDATRRSKSPEKVSPDRRQSNKKSPERRPSKPSTDRSSPERRSFKSTTEESSTERRSFRLTTERSSPERRSSKPTTERSSPERRSSKPTPERSSPDRRHSSRQTTDRSSPERRSSKPTTERSPPERRHSSRQTPERNITREVTTTSYESTRRTTGKPRSEEPIKSSTTTTTNVFKSSLKKTEPKSKTPASPSQPEWVTQRNLRKTGSNDVVKKSSVSSSSTTVKKQSTRSSSTQESESTTNLIQSSYGIGPTDENGAPLFGLRALRAQNTNGNTKVQGTVISSQYYSETGKEPVGQISFTKYSSDPRDLGSNEDLTQNDDILSVTTTQKYGYDDTPSLKQLTSSKKEICDSQTDRRRSSTTKSSTVTRRNSVKALTQKFVENAGEVSKNERQSSYPKAGLILRSSSFKNESAVDDDYEDFSGEERRKESVSVQSSSSKTVSGGTFLRNKSKVTGVQDAITRMKTEDVEYGDTEEDIQAKDLLNKYLGTQVILSGIEGQVSRTGTSSSKGSSFSTSSKSTSKVTTVTMENGKEVTRTRTFEHPISDDVLETVWDEQTLRYLLDQSTNYEERKKLRARLRVIMAEQEACTELVKQASQDQSSQSIDETIQTSKEVVSEGPVTTTKVTRVSTQQHISKKPMSPFAKFRQLDKQNSLNTPPSTPRTPGGSPLFKFTDAALSQSASTIKDRLLHWCRMKTKEYENIQLDNFSTSWADGLAFCALVHHFLPDAFDYHALTPKERRHNFTLAFKVADEKADIAPLLDVDDMVATMRPDWKCVFTYVQSIYRRFKDED